MSENDKVSENRSLQYLSLFLAICALASILIAIFTYALYEERREFGEIAASQLYDVTDSYCESLGFADGSVGGIPYSLDEPKPKGTMLQCFNEDGSFGEQIIIQDRVENKK